MSEELVDIVKNMLIKYGHEAGKAIIRVGKSVIEGESDTASILAYHEAQAKVVVLDELLEKIVNTPVDTDKPKHNPFCNETIRDSQGNEIGRARGI